MDEMRLISELSEHPIYEYAFINAADVPFTDRVRHICRTECPMYGKSWACPPAVGSVEECCARVNGYDRGLLFSTVAEVDDITDMHKMLETRAPHEDVTRVIVSMIRRYTTDVLALSAHACDRCEVCTFPDAPCRMPQDMYPCIESYGIPVSVLAEQNGMSCFEGGNVVTWFSLILYNTDEEDG